MRGEWIVTDFADAIDFQEGPGILAKDFQDHGVPLIRLSGLDRGTSLLTGCNYLNPDLVAKKWAHFALRKGDTLLSTSASLGRIAVVDDDDVGAIAYTGIIRMRPRDDRLIPSFIRYLLEGPDFQQQAEAFGAGSVIRHFGPMHLRKMQVLLPPPYEQRAIAHILGTLDDKIELLRRQNETLEAMARALFKAWFVDFEPVRAKMNLPSPPGRGAGGEGIPSPAGRGAWGEGATKPKLPSDLLDFARELRTRMTDAEALLWHLLRNRRLADAKFRRQHPFPPYVLDFYCHEHKLAVEIDGGQHNEEAGRRHDARRDAFLAEHGLRVLRFWSHDVLQQTEAVLEAIFQAIVEHRLPSPPAPLSGKEGGKLPSPPTPLPEGEGSFGTLGADGVWHWPQHILDLFPDRLVESELGEIPEGWEVGCVDNAFDLTMGQSPPGATYNETGEGLPFYQGRADFKFRFPERRVYCTAPTRQAKAGDTLISVRAPVGDINMASEDCAIGRGVAAARHKSGARSFTYYFMHGLADVFGCFEAEGTVFGSISKKDFHAIRCVVAPGNVVEAFERVCGFIDSRIESGEHEIRTLAQLRDTLLPKLISGELHVKDAEAFLKERGL